MSDCVDTCYGIILSYRCGGRETQIWSETIICSLSQIHLSKQAANRNSNHPTSRLKPFFWFVVFVYESLLLDAVLFCRQYYKGNLLLFSANIFYHCSQQVKMLFATRKRTNALWYQQSYKSFSSHVLNRIPVVKSNLRSQTMSTKFLKKHPILT